MSEFAECLKEMRDHYKANISAGRLVRYAPSGRFAQLVSAGKSNTLEPASGETVEGLKVYTQSVSRDEASSTEGHITAETQTLKDNNVTPEAQASFRERIEAQRERAKAKSAENIDKVFNEALKVGEANPKSQGAILSVMDAAYYLINDLYDRIASYVSSIVQTLVQWVKTAWENISSTFNNIGSWISGWFSSAAIAA